MRHGTETVGKFAVECRYNRKGMRILGLSMNNDKCSACVESKAGRSIFYERKKQSQEIRDLIHSDLTPKPASCGNIQNHKYGQKTKKEAPSRPNKGHNLRNTRMVPRWG